jgi:glycosyltransferase involved in cell wall biosynthesis
MKLLYITNGINGAGGLERVLSIKASYLAEHYNYDVTILSLNNNHLNPFYDFSDKIKLRSIDVTGGTINYLSTYIKGVKCIVHQLNPDVISVCDDGLKAFIIPKLINSKIPVIYERHVSKEIEMNQDYTIFKKLFIKLKWKMMEYLATGFSKFVVLTNGNINEWKSLSNLSVIPNPLTFYPENSSSLQQKKVLAVGKQGYQKGYDRLLNAWAIVNAKYSDWHLDIYGTIAPEFKLEALASELEIKHSVSFYQPEKDIQSKYLDASIYVMSSRFEGFGMVLIEAMACGVPCVSFDCNYGPSDIIHNNEDGYIVENGDTTQLASKIKTLIENYEIRREMGVKAKRNVKRFLPKVIVKQWDELFKSLVH